MYFGQICKNVSEFEVEEFLEATVASSTTTIIQINHKYRGVNNSVQPWVYRMCNLCATSVQARATP